MWPTTVPLANGTTYNSVTTFYVVANMGVVLFMFLLGCELDHRLMSKQVRVASLLLGHWHTSPRGLH